MHFWNGLFIRHKLFPFHNIPFLRRIVTTCQVSIQRLGIVYNFLLVLQMDISWLCLRFIGCIYLIWYKSVNLLKESTSAQVFYLNEIIKLVTKITYPGLWPFSKNSLKWKEDENKWILRKGNSKISRWRIVFGMVDLETKVSCKNCCDNVRFYMLTIKIWKWISLTINVRINRNNVERGELRQRI